MWSSLSPYKAHKLSVLIHQIEFSLICADLGIQQTAIPMQVKCHKIQKSRQNRKIYKPKLFSLIREAASGWELSNKAAVNKKSWKLAPPGARNSALATNSFLRNPERIGQFAQVTNEKCAILWRKWKFLL